MRHESTTTDEEYVGLKFLYRVGSSPNAPLVVLIHGRAGNVKVMWSFERCIPEDAAVVSFEATLPDRENGGMSWWEMGASATTAPEQVLAAVHKVSYALGQFIQLQSLSPSKIVFLGFSQGAALISTGMVCGELSGDGFGLLCGFIPRFACATPCIQGLPEAFIAHGINDPVVAVDRARQGVAFLRERGLQVTYVEEEVEHKLGILGTRALKTWLARVWK